MGSTGDSMSAMKPAVSTKLQSREPTQRCTELCGRASRMPKPAEVAWLALLGLPKVGKSRASRAARTVAIETESLVDTLKPGRSRRMPRAFGWSKNRRPDGSRRMSNIRSASKRTLRASSCPNCELRLKTPPGEVQ